jgi:Pyruvate/2-oxoacid:ferredoxin oxidoreductase gamma subunit
VAALGGEGGGVLADWLIEAALHEGFPAQKTSIPGVSQRTGATTYYVEMYPEKRRRPPVMALVPSPGGIDLMAASELVEAGRAMQNAFITPERTTLVASTHRIYATSEKMVPTDGRYDVQKILEAAPKVAQKAVLFDMSRLAQEAGTVINAVLFGAMAGSGALPLSREACEAAIRGAGKGADASLRGFAARAIAAASTPLGKGGGERSEPGDLTAAKSPHPPLSPAGGGIFAKGEQSDRIRREFPAALHDLLDEAVARLSRLPGRRLRRPLPRPHPRRAGRRPRGGRRGGRLAAHAGSGAPARPVDELRGHHPRRRPEDPRQPLRPRAQGSRREGRADRRRHRLPQAQRQRDRRHPAAGMGGAPAQERRRRPRRQAAHQRRQRAFSPCA